MSTTPVLSANFSGLTTEINRVFSVMSGKTPVLSGPPGPTGPEGPTGPKAATGPTGATGIGIGTTLKGTWTPSGSYGTNGGTSPDAVTYNGSFYVCLNNGVTSSTPPDQDTTNWLRYIQQGGTGPTGLQGNTGPSGATGIGIGTTLQGRWQNGANYYSRSGVNADAVTYSGAFYVCISNISPSTIPPNQDSDHWLAYVDIGPTGATGTLGIDGVTGPTGPIGIGIGTTLKGAWVAGQPYSTNSGTNPDAVTYSGSLYICIQTVTSSVTPDQDPTNWQLYVRQGETGPSGPPGASGVTGPTGIKGDLGFTGPAGATGLKGDTGMTGPAGSISSVGSDGQLLYNRGGILAATGSMMFRPTGPTGPLGQVTGPIGQPTLQLGAYLVPTTDATYDLGATGIQFKDVHFSGSLYNNGVPFSGGGGGVSGLVYRETGPTGPDGQPTGPAPNPTLQMSAYLVPTTDATYDLGATGIRFKDEFLSGSLYMGATGATGVNIVQTGLIPSHTLEDTTTGPTLNYSQTLTKPGLYTTRAIYGSLPPAQNQVTYAPRVILNSARGYATGPTALTNGDILGAITFNENENLRAYVASIKSGATETEDVSLLLGTTTGGGNSHIIINSTGPTGPTGDPTGPVGKNIGLNAHMYPMDNATYNLGATGFQFKDIHFSGTIYNNGSEFQGGVSGLTYRATGPTGPQGQPTGPTGPTLQINAHLVPTEDLAYDLGATGLRFRDLYVGGTSIHIGDHGIISSTNDGLSLGNQYGTLSLMEASVLRLPIINTDLTDPNRGPILCVANSADGTKISVGAYYSPAGYPNTYILTSSNGGLTTRQPYAPTPVTEIGPIASIAMDPYGLKQFAVSGSKAPWPGNDFQGGILRSTNSGDTWDPLDTDTPAINRSYTSVTISSEGNRLVATHLTSGTGGTLVNPGFVYSVNADNVNPVPSFTKVTTYGPSSTTFTAPRFVNISQDGTRFIIMDVRTGAGQTDVICFNMTSGTPAYLTKFTFSSVNVLVSNLTTAGFSVLYTTGTAGDWDHNINSYTWSDSPVAPTLNITSVLYNEETSTGIIDLQLISTADGLTQAILPTYSTASPALTDGIYISNDSWATWRFLSNNTRGIQTSNTNTVRAIGITSTNMYLYVYNLTTLTTTLYSADFTYNVVNVKNGTSGLTYTPDGLGPTGPTGQPTGPSGATLQLSAHIMPTEDITSDLGTPEKRIRNLYVGGTTIQLGDSLSLVNSSVQVTGNILPTQDLTYNLGAADARFNSLYVGGTSIHMGDNMVLTSTNDGFSVENQTGTLSLVERVDTTVPKINEDITTPNRGPILCVANSDNGTYLSIGTSYTNAEADEVTHIIGSTDGGITITETYEPTLVSEDGAIASIAMTLDGAYQIAVFGTDGYTGPIILSLDSGVTWDTLDTDATPKKRSYTSVTISSDGTRVVATHLTSGTGGGTLVDPGFVCSTNATDISPTFIKVTEYGPDEENLTPFTAPRFVNISQDGARLIIMDVRTDDGETDVICFNMTSGTPVYLSIITFSSVNVLVSNLTSAGFSVLYTSGASGDWDHNINLYTWYDASVAPTLNTSIVLYNETTNDGLADLKFICTSDGLTQVVLPTYSESATGQTDGIYISYESGANWQFIENTSQGIPTSSTNTMVNISLTSSDIYMFLYNAVGAYSDIYKRSINRIYSDQIVNIKNGTSGLNYLPLGPTGPIGQPTGPSGPALIMDVNLVPTTDATYDLGATGIQFKDIYFSGSLYNNGVPFSGGGGGITAPTDNFMVAGGDGAGLAYSYDGTTWTPSPNGGTFNDCRAIAWNGSIWVLGTNNIVYSSDGINWTATNQTIMSPCLAVAWNGSIWVAGGDPETGGNAIAYSYDGINWTASPQGLIDTTCNALAWNGLIWVAGGSGTNRLAYSVDGINWTASESANTEFTEGGQCNCVAWNGTMWVAGGANNSSTGVLVYSYDGMNWSPVSLDGAIVMANYNTVAWNGSIWLAGGEGDSMFMIQSSDGISWVSITDRSTMIICRSITWNGTKWFAAGQASSGAGILASSTDGLLWADVTYTGFSTFSYTIASRRVLPFVGTGGSIPGLYYRASGPTGPTGGQTGPTGPWLQVSANMVPVTDNVFDLGATGLRFRDIHVGGSTIYLGDSVSIKATNEGALTVSNNAGTVNLVTPTGLNGGILSGIGTIVNNSGTYYGVETFYPPFAFPPVVVACLTSYPGTNTGIYIPKESVTESECRIYANSAAGDSLNYYWIATARTNYPFEFYNAATPITEVSVTDSSLVLSVNTSLLLRGGVQPYTAQMISPTVAFDPIPINMYTGVQTITIVGLNPGQTYEIYISATDNSAAPAISSTNQQFTTAAGPLIAAVISLATISEENRTNSQLPFDITENASGGSGDLTNTWQSKVSSASTWTDDLVSNYLLDVTIGITYNVRIMTTDGAGSTVYSNVITATLYATLTIGDGSVSPASQDVTVGQVVTINIATGNLFDGGVAPYSFTVYGLQNGPPYFTLDLQASQIPEDNPVGIASITVGFSSAQTTYLIDNDKTLVYKWTSSGTAQTYNYYLNLSSADEQTYNNTATPYSFTLVELAAPP